MMLETSPMICKPRRYWPDVPTGPSPGLLRKPRTITLLASMERPDPFRQRPSPGAVWAAMVRSAFLTTTVRTSSMIPPVRKTTIRGPLCPSQAQRNVPGAGLRGSSVSESTIRTLPPQAASSNRARTLQPLGTVAHGRAFEELSAPRGSSESPRV